MINEQNEQAGQLTYLLLLLLLLLLPQLLRQLPAVRPQRVAQHTHEGPPVHVEHPYGAG